MLSELRSPWRLHRPRYLRTERLDRRFGLAWNRPRGQLWPIGIHFSIGRSSHNIKFASIPRRPEDDPSSTVGLLNVNDTQEHPCEVCGSTIFAVYIAERRFPGQSPANWPTRTGWYEPDPWWREHTPKRCIAPTQST